MRFGQSMRRAALILGFALALAVPIQAQSSWPVYLLDTGAKALVRVGSDGTQVVYPLGLAANAFISAYDIGFSADGARVAMCPVDYGTADTPPSAALIVRDIAAQADLMRVDLGPALGCRVSYRADGAFLAVGIVHYVPGEVQAVPDLPAWELRVIDPSSGGTLAQLTSNSPEAAASGLPANPPVLPVVRRFEGAELTFAALPFAAGGPGVAPAFVWRVDTATLTPVESWGQLQFDTLAGDLTWNTADTARPAGQAPGSLTAANVSVWQNAANAARAVFTSPDWLLIDTRFIDDGRRLALQLVAPLNAGYPEDVGYPTRWVAVDRAGVVEDLTSTSSYAQVRGAPGGYVVLQVFAPEGGGPSIYTLDYNVRGEIRTLWTQQTDAVAYDLAWAPPMALAADLPPFAALP